MALTKERQKDYDNGSDNRNSFGMQANTDRIFAGSDAMRTVASLTTHQRDRHHWVRTQK